MKDSVFMRVLVGTSWKSWHYGYSYEEPNDPKIGGYSHINKSSKFRVLTIIQTKIPTCWKKCRG